jgi:hypothetical protein
LDGREQLITKFLNHFILLYEFAATEVHGYAGGIMVGWKRDSIMVDVVTKHFQFMHLRV